MQQYLLRLDDASEYMDVEKWKKMEDLLAQYNICPLVGIIPYNQDESLVQKYPCDSFFWDKVKKWINKGWSPALHGYNHKYITTSGGINPVNQRSEFAGVDFKVQCEKIKKGYQILTSHNIDAKVFFAPSHTFDVNTLEAIKKETPIRVISDTVANDIYFENDFYFIPQQTGKVRKLPFRFVTFCYHPNTMENQDFQELEQFLKKYWYKFIQLDISNLKSRKKNVLDLMAQKLYFIKQELKRKLS